MNKLRYLIKSINILNCLLMLAVAASAQVVIVPLLNLKIQPTLPAARANTTALPAPPAPLPNLSPADYVMVGEQNLFHPERTIPPEKKVEPVIPKPKPELVLYGTLITDNLSIAYIEDKKGPNTTSDPRKRQTQVKKGDSISGYVLQEVGSDRIVLVKGEERLVVMLDSKDKKRGGETTPVAATSPGSQPSKPAASIVSQPAATPPAQSGATFTRPGQHTYDPRRIRLQNK